jgi:hypothetical protein
MHKAVTKEGPCAPLFCLGVALLIAAGGTAAQTVEQSDLELCASLETSELKLACFEALTASEGKGAPSATDAAPEPLPESTATEKALISTGAAAGVAGSDAGPVAPALASDDQADVADDLGQETPNEIQADVATELGRELPDEEQVDRADEIGREHPDEEQVDLVDELSREQPDEGQVDLADELGREHLDEEKVDDKEKAVVHATVSEVVRGSYDLLYFHLTNGQVWRQVEGRRFSYPRDSEFDVTINSGMMGDYRLRLEAGGPMIGIRRVQ